MTLKIATCDAARELGLDAVDYRTTAEMGQVAQATRARHLRTAYLPA